MAPKKVRVSTSKQKAASNSKRSSVKNNNEPVKSYKQLIVEALISLNARRGSSRLAIKRYIREKYPSIGVTGGFDSYINNAIKKGIESKEFEFPRGPTGGIKLHKRFHSNTDRNKEIKTRGRPRKEANKSISVKKRQMPKSKVTLSPTYKEMIINGILQLNNGKGSSRSALKKFIKDQYKNDIKVTSKFDHLFNRALKKGIECGDLHQPKGPSGIIKVLKKKKPGNAAIKAA